MNDGLLKERYITSQGSSIINIANWCDVGCAQISLACPFFNSNRNIGTPGGPPAVTWRACCDGAGLAARLVSMSAAAG